MNSVSVTPAAAHTLSTVYSAVSKHFPGEGANQMFQEFRKATQEGGGGILYYISRGWVNAPCPP